MILVDILVRDCGCKVITIYVLTRHGVYVMSRTDTSDCIFTRMEAI